MQDLYDLAIIGGGIAGAGIARDAALRGFKVILLEKNTFGSGTSSKSSKLIHGGIRYLEIAANAFLKRRFKEAWKNFHFVFLALKETHTLEKIAPALAKPLPLVIPVYQSGGRSKWVVWFGTFLYYFLARLTGPLPCPKILWSQKSVLEVLPSLNPDGLTGGIILWDHTTDDKKLVEATIHSAAEHGAEVYEHTPVLSYSFDAKTKQYNLSIEREGKSSTVSARKIINASGAWVDKVRGAANETGENLIVPVAGSHIEFRKFVNSSVILRAKDGRVFFVINHGEVSRVGTTEWVAENPDNLQTPEKDVDYLLESLRHYFPAIDFKKKDILGMDSGIRPLAKPKDSFSLNSISREHEIRLGPTGVIHVLGVKLTDHRRAAEEIVDYLAKELDSNKGTARKKSRTSLEPL